MGRGREKLGLGGLVLTALAREVMLLVAFGAGLDAWRRGSKRDAVLRWTLPTLATLGWAAYVSFRIDFDSAAEQVQGIGPPFLGFLQAIPLWFGDPIAFAGGLAVMLILLIYPRRAIQGKTLVGMTFIGFAFLGFFFTDEVWQSLFDITRAVAPLITAFILIVFASGHSKSDVSTEIGVPF
jgi:hypothetical protein